VRLRAALLALTTAVVAPTLVLLASPTSTTAAAPRPLVVSVLSNRADLISGGDALVSVRLPQGVAAKSVHVYAGSREVTKRFALRSGHSFAGLVTGLPLGATTIRATAPGLLGTTVITNHRNGGPVFSGPQSRYYQCQPTANDRQCNQPVRYTFLYRSTNPTKAGLQPYDPRHPAGDVASTTTDRGVTVPFIVRLETGYQDRDQYKIFQLFRPAQAWTTFTPQRQWNHKLLITHGGGCGASYAPGEAPVDDLSGTIPVSVPGVESSYVTALSRGFAVLSTALDNTGHNCSVAMQAESLMMAKERLVERYGTLRYTIGTGCSGGSIAQQTVANAYPGIYQGLVTTCSYPDTLTAGAQFADYHLLRLYFENPAKWAPGVLWSATQMAGVEGHLSHVNAIVADEGLFKNAINPEHACSGTKAPVAGDRSTRYDSDINPGGVRCSILEMWQNLIGVRPTSVWSTWEQKAGHGFAGLPAANTGIQYGLNAWKQGLITTDQFLDLNARIGGLDINADPIAQRIAGDPTAIARAYRTGLVNEGNHMDEVAIINHGGPDPGLAHDYAHAFWMEERLRRDQGTTPNRVMWFGTTPLIGDPRWANEAFLDMDRWLSRVEKDHRNLSLARKIGADRPADVTDRCANIPGVDLVSGPDGPLCKQDLTQLHLSTPREVAGDDVANDRLSCRLRPLARTDYSFAPVPLSDAQWATLQAIFPQGVCDYGRPGIGQQPAQTWLGYGTAREVVYGGRNLPGLPAHSAGGWQSPAFRSVLTR
jgi:hypothetical protein